MTETEDPGYAERDDDEFSEQTGGGVEDPLELEDVDDPVDEDSDESDF